MGPRYWREKFGFYYHFEPGRVRGTSAWIPGGVKSRPNGKKCVRKGSVPNGREKKKTKSSKRGKRFLLKGWDQDE